MALNVAKSRYAVPTQIVFHIVNTFGLVVGVIYNGKTPDLYVNNKHGSIGWVASLAAGAWMIMSLICLYARSFGGSGYKRRHSGQPITSALMAQYRRVMSSSPQEDERRWSGDSGQGTERNSESLYNHSRSPSLQSEAQMENKEYGEDEDDESEDFNDREQRGLLRRVPGVDRFLSRSVRKFVSFKKPLFAIHVATVVLDRMILLFGFLGITTGAIVYGGIFVSQFLFKKTFFPPAQSIRAVCTPRRGLSSLGVPLILPCFVLYLPETSR